MKIGIDGTALTIPYPCGTKKYATHLIEALAQIDSENTYFLFTPEKVAVPARNFQVISVPRIVPKFKRQLLTIPRTLTEEFDVFHYLDPFGVMFHHHPRAVLTVHDLGVGYVHKWLGRNWYKRWYTEWMLSRAIQRASSYITVSKNIKSELEEYLKKNKINNRPIVPIYHGVPKFNTNLLDSKKPKKKYFMVFGDFAWRKNTSMVVKAYTQLPKKIQNEYSLKLIVSSKDFESSFKEMVSKLNLGNRIHIHTNVSEQHLKELYQRATALVYPSLYEGFGFPIIEAMSLKCPVITSNRGATKEIAGYAAYLISPLQPDDITAAMYSIITDELIRRKKVELGLRRTKNFTWEKTARQTLQVYERTAQLSKFNR